MSATTIRRRGSLLGAAAAVLLIAGCGTGAAADTPRSSPDAGAATESTTSSPSPQPSHSSDATPSPRSSSASQPSSVSQSSSVSQPSSTSSSSQSQSQSQSQSRGGSQASTGDSASHPSVMDASVPKRLRVPAIDINTSLLKLGRQPDGAAAVPPGREGAPAGWYKYSPTPGERGPSVILGHVNSLADPSGVFFRLHELHAGQKIEVDRADGSTAVFTVTEAAVYSKDEFPTFKVYGNTDGAQLRLITCGGYSPGTNEYETNLVVYATLSGSHG